MTIVITATYLTGSPTPKLFRLQNTSASDGSRAPPEQMKPQLTPVIRIAKKLYGETLLASTNLLSWSATATQKMHKNATNCHNVAHLTLS